MPTKKDIKKFRADPMNYRYRGCLYHCSKDPYLIIPKQIRWMGWTINFGHPKAIFTLKWIIAATTIPLIFVIFIAEKPLTVEFAVVLQIIILSMWAHHQASKKLYTEPVRQEVFRMPRKSNSQEQKSNKKGNNENSC